MNVEPIIDRVISDNADTVKEWIDNKPGSWGGISGKALIAVKNSEDRSLTDDEKKLVWQVLWTKLEKIKLERS